jgi:hypothetical protein
MTAFILMLTLSFSMHALVLHVHDLRLILCPVYHIVARLSTHLYGKLGAVSYHQGTFTVTCTWELFLA